MDDGHDARSLFTPAGTHETAKVLIIAEIGVNHDGDVEQAHRLIHVAKQAGADAVKFQHFHPDRLLSRDAMLADYQQDHGDDPAAMLGGLALTLENLAALREHARAVEIGFIVTPFSLGDVDEVRRLRVDAVKIASPDAVNLPLLRAVMTLRCPLVISTGTCELDELTTAAGLIKHHRWGGAMLQCVSSYPVAMADAALGGIVALKDCFNLPIGYSDHTTDLATGSFAVAAGACVLEKHLTHDTNASGPDHAASLGPEEFARYVAMARQAAAALGPLIKQPQQVEQEVRLVSRQSICLRGDRAAGHVLTAADLEMRRPGTGIQGLSIDRVVGSTLRHDKAGGIALQWDDVLERASSQQAA